MLDHINKLNKEIVSSKMWCKCIDRQDFVSSFVACGRGSL